MKRTSILIAILIQFFIASFSYADDIKKEMIGAWKSNREMTLKTFDLDNIPEKIKKTLTAPDFFGHLIHIYGDGEAITITYNKCYKTTFVVLETKDNYILMQSNESKTEPSEPTKIFFENDLMWLEFKKPYREIFTRVKISDLIEQYECLEPLLPLRGLPVQ